MANKLWLPTVVSVIAVPMLCFADAVPGTPASPIVLQPIQIVTKKPDPSVVSTPPSSSNTYFKSQPKYAIMNLQQPRKYDAFLASVSDEYKIKRGFLKLDVINDHRSKRSFNFLFLMNGRSKADKIKDGPRDSNRQRLHILWPGSSKKGGIQQQEIKDKYPVDVSIANYSDGYATDQWNLVLPAKKPREVKVTFMWAF